MPALIGPARRRAARFARAGPQSQGLDFVARALEVQDGEIGAEYHLVLAVAVDVLHEGLGPVPGAVRVRADIDVGMLPGHGDHLLGPGYAHVYPDDLQLGKIAGHRVQADGPTHAAQPVRGVVDHGLPHLELHRHVQLRALGVEGIPLGVVGRELEPVGIEMRADEAVFPHALLQFAHAPHAFRGVQSGQPVEAVRMAVDRLGHRLVGHVIAGAMLPGPHLGGDQESLLDTGGIHAA